MPDRVVPMMARLAKGVPPEPERYGYEFKWDGVRGVAYSAGGTLRLQSRSLDEITHRYPEVRALSDALGSHEVVLDGEIVALDATGRPSFERLQQRMGLNSETEIRRKMREVPVAYFIFDLLYLDGRSLMRQPYVARRQALDTLQLAGSAWQVPPWVAGDGPAMIEASRMQNLEGVMAKLLDSPYQPGVRTDAWLKIKNHLRQEFVIGGWLDGQGRRQGVPGAILVGSYDGDDLVYAGKVGTGFTERMLDDLAQRFQALAGAESPFTAGSKPPRAAHFIEPKLVCEVEFNEWTKAGQLRAPSFKGLRNDKNPRQVVREVPVK
jgi:bifunctional non-homologous end joining protein LigD